MKSHNDFRIRHLPDLKNDVENRSQGTAGPEWKPAVPRGNRIMGGSVPGRRATPREDFTFAGRQVFQYRAKKEYSMKTRPVWTIAIRSSFHWLCRSTVVVPILGILLLLFSAPVNGKDQSKTDEINKKIGVLTQKMAQCGGDMNCLQKLSQEMQALSAELQSNAMKTTPGSAKSQVAAGVYANRVPVTVQVHHATEYKHIEKSGELNRPYEAKVYFFEYSAEEEGYLDHSKDFGRFMLRAPQQALYNAREPNHFKIIRDMGYRQSVERNDQSGGYQLRQYADGPFIRIDSMNKTFAFSILHPAVQPGLGNVTYGPISILVRNQDTSCPSCDTSLHESMAIDPVRFETGNGDKRQFMITPDIIRKALKAGKLERTFQWKQTIDENGGYQKDRLIVSILFNAGPGKLAVSPSAAFQSAGPTEKGQFVPASVEYTLQNIGGSAIEFNVAKKEPWLILSRTDGSLEPGSSTVVKASIGSKASNLENGIHPDQIRFTNTTNGKGNTSREVKLTVGEEQIWRITVKGFEVDDLQKPTTFKDTDGSTKKLHKRLKFNWQLVGEFVLEKKKKQWTFKQGAVKSAAVNTVPVFTPPSVYQCKTAKCPPPNVPISTMIGGAIFGHVSGKTVNIQWPPRQPGGCVSCKATVASLPKTPYEGAFKSVDFVTQIGLEYFDLKDGWSRTYKKKKWLSYTVTVKRLK